MNPTNSNRFRRRINIKLDSQLLSELRLLRPELDYPVSRIVEEGIEYILRAKRNFAVSSITTRSSINLTINPHLWNSFKEYADKENVKLTYFIEEGIKHSIRKYRRKARIKNGLIN